MPSSVDKTTNIKLFLSIPPFFSCLPRQTEESTAALKNLYTTDFPTLLKMKDRCANRNEALMDLLLTNQENLLYNISVSERLGCADHNIADFRIQLSMLKVNTKTKVFYLRRAS